MKTSHLLGLPASLLLLLATRTAAQLPYNPTRVLLPPQNENDDLLYVFRPSSAFTGQFELLSLDLSSDLTAENLPLTTLYPSLPFLDEHTLKAFAPVIDSGGNVTVYTGDCADGPGGAELWKFVPKKSARNGNGSWVQEALSLAPASEQHGLAGPNYLASSISFSSVVSEDEAGSSIYTFGGMCPFEDASQNEWIWAANYSNSMVKLDPAATPNEFELGLTASRGPPITEAGFSITPLLPTFSNKSDGTQNQQQDFVLLGGHTEEAFINMSQVALFSLPQESWTFLPVNQAPGDHSDLAVRDVTTQISPRSGHTAVLTPDGRTIVVLGGWVKDVNTPAEPQLAVLNVGAGYGGKADWSWTFPPSARDGLARGTGLYGHGAAMLPGGVMMVTGGYSIPSTSDSRLRKRITQNTRNLFYNVTSNSWLSAYTLPSDARNGAGSPHSGPLSTTSQKAGLGAGLVVGFAAVVGLVVFYFWYTHRQKKQREFREQELRELSLGAQRFIVAEHGGAGADGRGGNMSAAGFMGDREMAAYTAYPWSNGGPLRDGQGYRRVSTNDAQRTGLQVEIPSPTRGLRRGANPHGSYHAVPRYDDKRRSRGSGTIHPIKESEEEHNTQSGIVPHSEELPEMTERDYIDNRASLFSQAPTLDPFNDPDPLGSHPVNISRNPSQTRPTTSSCPVSPIDENNAGAQSRTLEWERAADRLLQDLTHPNSTESNSAGRTSPSRSEESRTGSNLSDRSVWSNISSRSSNGGVVVSVARSLSIRSANLLNSLTNPFLAPAASPLNESPPATRDGLRLRGHATGARPASQDAESFMTAQTSFAALKAEGEAIFGGLQPRYRDDPSSPIHQTPIHLPTPDAVASGPRDRPNPNPEDMFASSSPSKEKPRLSWMGSVRRALSRSRTSARAGGRTVSLVAHAAPILEPYRDNPSPVHEHGRRATAPRRTVSDATPWRYRRGARDWDDSNPPDDIWRRHSGDDWGSPEDIERKEQGDEEWDVEAAAERRIVQVTFTVPRTRLRVVNADVDGLSLVSKEEVVPEKVESEGAGSGRPANEENSGLLKVRSRDDDAASVRSKNSRVLAMAKSFEQRVESPAIGEGSRGARDTGALKSVAAPYVQNS